MGKRWKVIWSWRDTDVASEPPYTVDNSTARRSDFGLQRNGIIVRPKLITNASDMDHTSDRSLASRLRTIPRDPRKQLEVDLQIAANLDRIAVPGVQGPHVVSTRETICENKIKSGSCKGGWPSTPSAREEYEKRNPMSRLDLVTLEGRGQLSNYQNAQTDTGCRYAEGVVGRRLCGTPRRESMHIMRGPADIVLPREQDQ
ncbi:hypothetical protein FN846DRAFT_888938 [Sphaerosporella brunnea]|uniref:Uncharacterized protein n=1 Tax=Sphaerosporella brunnea TaxID=1250544 RepID=A0A5J5F1M9_9PEZI|nr:hypothetical protein FN846DRAFT_888938 [Sphaerosporella brunnea]